MDRQSYSFISKDESLYVKGIAIVFMFIHHLFTFPDRIPKNIEIIQLYDKFNIEQFSGYVGKYCVPIFLFVSGYGFAIKKQEEIKYYVKKVLDIYLSAWLVFIIFIPVAYYVFHVQRITLEPKLIFLNMMGLSSSYNGEWWFLLPYAFLVLITPLLHSFKNKIISILAISICVHNISAQGMWQHVLYWQTSYILGFSFCIYSSYFYRFKRIIFFIPFVFIIYFGLIYFSTESMVFLVPLMVMIICMLYKISHAFIKRVIIELGDKSLFMWLVHSFYCYYIAKDFIYSPQYTILILLNLLIISYITALFLQHLYRYIILFFNKIHYLTSLMTK